MLASIIDWRVYPPDPLCCLLVPLICQFMVSKGFVSDRLLTRQAKKMLSVHSCWIFVCRNIFSPPGKHTIFHQGHKGSKAKGLKVIKARGQEILKSIFLAFYSSVSPLHPILRHNVPNIIEPMEIANCAQLIFCPTINYLLLDTAIQFRSEIATCTSVWLPWELPSWSFNNFLCFNIFLRSS